MKTVFVVILLAMCLSSFAADKFEYVRPDGFSFTITKDGLTSIKMGDRVIADGNWQLLPATQVVFMTGNPAGWRNWKPFVTKTMQVLGPNRVKVRLVDHDINTDTVFFYTFEGEDLTIKAKVTPSWRRDTLKVVHFGTLNFHFDRVPDGMMLHGASSQDYSGGVPWCMHPGHMDKIGGSWATDGTFGLGLTPMNTGFTRSQLYWVGDDKLSYGATGWKYPMKSLYWNGDIPDASTTMAFHYYAEKPIPPGGTETFYLKMRLSKNQDWHHLLQPYKDHFLATYGAQRYNSDHRFYSMGGLSDGSWRGPGNPWGFQQYRRIDQPEGMKNYCQAQVDRLKAANGQGTLLWAYQGFEPRGAIYRTDFDIIPPEVAANFPRAKRIYGDAGMRFGLTSRPGQITYRKTWSADDVLGINPDDPQQLDSYVRRFRNAIKMGATAFYLDSFGDSLEAVKMVKYYREKLGPDIRMYAEQHCDAILPYCGIYTEISYTKDTQPRSDYSLAWIDTHFVEVARWILGDMDSVVPTRKEGPGGAEDAYRWLYRLHLTPLVQDWNFGMKEDALRSLQGEYVDQRGHWKQ